MAAENVTAILNDTINQTAANVTAQPDYITNVLWPRMQELVLAPAQNPEMLWTLTPMLIALVLMQLYFGRNKDEALGWNTAFGNSVALIFISMSLLRSLYISSDTGKVSDFLASSIMIDDVKILIIAFLFAYGLFLSLLSFFHWIPERLAFFMMSGISINVTAYVCIVLVGSEIPLNKHTIAAGFVIFVLVYIIAMIVRILVPASEESKRHLLERRKHVLDAQARHFEHKAKKVKSDWRRKRLSNLADKYRSRAHDVSAKIARIK